MATRFAGLWDFFYDKWGDLIGLFLVLLGTAIVVFTHEEMSRDAGKGLVTAGLIALRPKTTARNGNGGKNDKNDKSSERNGTKGGGAGPDSGLAPVDKLPTA